jgi:hypothetical protein
VHWQPEKNLFYFAAGTNEESEEREQAEGTVKIPKLEDVVLAGPKLKRAVAKVQRFTSDSGEERVSYIKHLAFRPRFVWLDGAWYLAVVPDWYYSWDGEHEAARAADLRAGLKRMERNAAVTGHLKFWEHMLASQLGALMGSTYRSGTGGPLRTERVQVGIDDRVWQGSRARRAAAQKATAPVARRKPARRGRRAK